MRRRLALPLLVAAMAAACSGGAPPAATPAPSRPLASPSPSGTPSPSPSPSPTPAGDGLAPQVMYSGAAPDLTGYDPATLRTLVVTGDIIPARLVNHVLRVRGDYAYPFRAVSTLLHSGDVTYVNFESPLLASCPDITTGFDFCTDARVGPAMAAAGVSVVNVANNHSTNGGQEGLQQTEARLRADGMQVSGFGAVATRDVRGLRFAFLGFNLVGARLDPDELRREIVAARAQADVVVVQFHWGREYETYPFPAPGIAPDDPRQAGRLAIDDGADLVIGNHPHCVQGSEMYHGHLITYAHGNFVFDQHWSVGTQEGVVGRYVFAGTRLVAVQYVPVRIVDDAQPRPLDPATGEGRSILDRMLRSTHELLGLSAPVLDGNGPNDACP